MRTKRYEFTLKLSNDGDHFDAPMLGMDNYTVEALDVGDWGATVVAEVLKVNGGVARSYSSAKNISQASVSFHEDVADETTEAIRVAITTPDSTKYRGRFVLIAQGKD